MDHLQRKKRFVAFDHEPPIRKGDLEAGLLMYALAAGHLRHPSSTAVVASIRKEALSSTMRAEDAFPGCRQMRQKTRDEHGTGESHKIPSPQFHFESLSGHLTNS